jgi:hypothetical protein
MTRKGGRKRFATPLLRTPDFELSSRALIPQNGCRSCDLPMRQFAFWRTFRNHEPASTSPEDATVSIKLRLTLFLQPKHGFG